MDGGCGGGEGWKTVHTPLEVKLLLDAPLFLELDMTGQKKTVRVSRRYVYYLHRRLN